MRISGTFISVLIALTLTGVLSARVSGASHVRVVARVILSGLLAMLVTYGVGLLFGATFL